jgi:hypothetical protein
MLRVMDDTRTQTDVHTGRILAKHSTPGGERPNCLLRRAKTVGMNSVQV